VRDRDRLRQQVLEDLGWRIHRIWSTDWFRAPQRELEKLLGVVEKAKKGEIKPTFSRPPEPAQRKLSGGESVEERPAPVVVPVYQRYAGKAAGSSEEFAEAGVEELLPLLKEIVRREGPVHETVLMRRAAEAWGIGRIGKRVSRKFGVAIERCCARGAFVRKGKFLWPKGMSVAPVRQRVDEVDRDIEAICQEEIGQAAVLALRLEYGMNRKDLVIQSARLLGFGNVGSRVAEAVEKAIEAESKAGAIVWDKRTDRG
jgi:hypothetical protein